LQGPVDSRHNRTRRDGGSGELVEIAAILLYSPAAGFWGIQRSAVETEDPAVLGQLDLVAQARCFAVTDHPHTSDATIGKYPHQQIDGAAVAVRRDRREDHRTWLAVVAGNVCRRWPPGAKQWVLDLDAAVEQLVVRAAARQGFVACARLRAAFGGPG